MSLPLTNLDDIIVDQVTVITDDDTPDNCDVVNGDIWLFSNTDVALFTSAEVKIATGISHSEGAADIPITAGAPWTFTTDRPNDELDVTGVAVPGGGIVGIGTGGDWGFGPGGVLFAPGFAFQDQCGKSGFIHNGAVDGKGCTGFLLLLPYADLTIDVTKSVWRDWNGAGDPRDATPFDPDTEFLDPGEAFHYVYEVDNTGDLPLTFVSSADNKCAPVLDVIVGGLNIGEVANAGQLDTFETWVYSCADTAPDPHPAVSTTVKNTATFTFEDRNGNDVVGMDMLTVETAYSCGGQKATWVGTNGNDTKVGGPGIDAFVGLDGRDKLTGLGGPDFLCGNGDRDQLTGSGGDDYLDGGDGPDLIRAAALVTTSSKAVPTTT